MLGVSDMVNPTRAKDAAVAWARSRGLGGGETARWHRREIDGIAPPMRPDPARSGSPTPNCTTKCSGRGGIPDGHGRAVGK
jgi:hypothetical protein